MTCVCKMFVHDVVILTNIKLLPLQAMMINYFALEITMMILMLTSSHKTTAIVIVLRNM